MTTPQTITVVAMFADREAAQRAAAELANDGIAPGAIHLHEHGVHPHSADGVMLDEYATGGFFTNFAHLLDGLMNAPRRSPSYDELVQFDGIALSVQADSLEQSERIEARLRGAGAERVKSGGGLDLS